jgi:hypothetical protein
VVSFRQLDVWIEAREGYWSGLDHLSALCKAFQSLATLLASHTINKRLETVWKIGPRVANNTINNTVYTVCKRFQTETVGALSNCKVQTTTQSFYKALREKSPLHPTKIMYFQ